MALSDLVLLEAVDGVVTRAWNLECGVVVVVEQRPSSITREQQNEVKASEGRPERRGAAQASRWRGMKSETRSSSASQTRQDKTSQDKTRASRRVRVIAT